MIFALQIAIPSIILSVLVFYGLVAYSIASRLTKPNRIEQEDDPLSHGLRYEDVEFRFRRDDVLLKGWYLFGETSMPTFKRA